MENQTIQCGADMVGEVALQLVSRGLTFRCVIIEDVATFVLTGGY